MPFNPEEYGLEPDPVEGESSVLSGDEAAQLVRAVTQQPPQYARRMSAVEEKLKVAAYYQMALDSDFFEDDDHFTRHVTNEIKDFIVKRLETLMGSPQTPTASADFSPEEIKALKLFAKRLLTPQAAKPQVSPVQPFPVQLSPEPPTPKKRRMAKVPGGATKPSAKVAPTVPPPAKGRKNRAGQFTSTGAIPVPQGTAFSAASEMQARQQIASNPEVQALGEQIARQ
jgi:hypothetical protein